MKHTLNIVKHHETLKTLWNTRTLVIRCDDIGARCGDDCVRCGDIGARMRRRLRSMRRHRRSARRRRRSRGVTGDCGVGVTPQMCNRVTNHGDMGTFSKPTPMQNPAKFFISHHELWTSAYMEHLVYTFSWQTAVNGVVEERWKYDILKAVTWRKLSRISKNPALFQSFES